jgi:hypothetical protein
MKNDSSASSAFIKTALVVLFAAAVVTIMSVFLSHNSHVIGSVIEGMETNAVAKAGEGGTIPKEDTDLKCPGTSRKDTKCAVADIIKLGYELASDPAMSQSEQDKIYNVFAARSKDKGSEKLSERLSAFLKDVMMLRFAVMFNTAPNEPELKKTLDEMVKEKDVNSCYTEDDMKQVKGLMVGSAEQKTLTTAQSEAVRCYMQRFNSIRACLGICNDNKV